MAQVSNPRLGSLATLEALTHALHLVLDRRPSAIEQVRVHVALQRDLVAYGRTGSRGLDAPVDADDVVAGVLGERSELRVRTLREERHGHGRNVRRSEFGAHARGDALQGREGELLEVVRRKLACPRVEDLQELRVGDQHWVGHGTCGKDLPVRQP